MWPMFAVAAGSLLLNYMGQKKQSAALEREAELQRRAGAARKAAAEFEAGVMEVQAGQVVAAAQRDAYDVQRMGKLAESRATALAAASGGGATSPTVLNLIGNLAKETGYNAMRAIYAGEEKARLMKLQARSLRQQGEFAQVSGDLAGMAADAKRRSTEIGGYGSVLSNGVSMYDKYGRGGPGTTSAKTDYFEFTGYDATGGPAYG